MANVTPTDHQHSRTWLPEWNRDDETFMQATGFRIAWRTMWITTFCLILSFATWFMVSVIAVRLQGVGFKLDKQQLFWIVSMPGLAGGTLRIIHTFLIPVAGSRHTIAFSTILLLLPCIGWAWAVQNPNTSFETFLALGFLAGLGGGNFSSFMPSTSLFFPRRLQGTALGIQAGVGNFGVSVAQFLIPWVIGLAMFASMAGAPQNFTKDGKTTQIFLQNGALVWAPFIVVAALIAWFGLKSVPTAKASFRQQTDIFKNKHTWLMTSLYIMTFGSFSGFSAAFPLMIKELFAGFPGGPDPLKYAFLGPLVGAASRVLFGPISDKLGGAKVTQVSGIGLLLCAIAVSNYVQPTSLEDFGPFLWLMLGIFFFSGVGNASTFKQMPMIFEARQAGGVIGWTSAIAAYGPFIFSVLIGMSIKGSWTAVFFYGSAAFYLLNLAINAYYYARKGAEKPC